MESEAARVYCGAIKSSIVCSVNKLGRSAAAGRFNVFIQPKYFYKKNYAFAYSAFLCVNNFNNLQ